MLSLAPRIWLSKVDLPTLGRPTMAIVPQRHGIADSVFMGSLSDRQHLPLVVRQHADCCPPLARRFARREYGTRHERSGSAPPPRLRPAHTRARRVCGP